MSGELNPSPKKRRRIEGNRNHIVWVDLEMTGLESYQKIVEMAVIVTDYELNIIAKGPDLVIYQPENILMKMNPWCKKTFKKNGLTKKIRASKISTSECETKCLNFIKKHCEKNESPLAGNSVHVDRMFLAREMPKFLSFLHYRIIDVSTVKELAHRWNPEVMRTAPPKICSHRALDDIEESIKELKHYRKYFFRKPEDTVSEDNSAISGGLSKEGLQ